MSNRYEVQPERSAMLGNPRMGKLTHYDAETETAHEPTLALSL